MGLIAFIQSLQTTGSSGAITWGSTDILIGSTTITFSN